MTQNHINILLYSKFSTASRKLVELIENYNIEDFNLLCIDNKKVRERITKSEKLNVKEVPSIIRLNQNTGLAESYEGNRAFQLINSYIDVIKQNMSAGIQQVNQVPPMNVQNLQQMTSMGLQQMPPMGVQQIPPMGVQNAQNVQNVQNVQNAQNAQNAQNVQNVSSMRGLSDDSLNVSMLQPESPPRQDPIQKQQKLINGTSIEDLGSDMNKGQTMNTYMHVPKSVEFDIDIENRQRTVKTDRSVKSSESGNIVNRAMQMQKEREQESSMTVQRAIS
jgi:hypothetical protein